jgi:hypothetical protein
MLITHDTKLYPLICKYFELQDLLSIGERMIGTGLIGGKSVGMLLAQEILKGNITNWREKFEQHDSFYIGSDVFYTYLVINKCWWIRYTIRKSKDPDEFLELASKARKILANGKFPKDILIQFKNMLNYYGQSPIIVRSSSLLEDAYGNAFSGKYESIFLTNQGNPSERLEGFIDAVRKVYKSTLSGRALKYRLRRNLLDKDEQMAILVQRVSGANYSNLFYPQLAGVGYSFNPFKWDKQIDPHAGMIRLVFGLGTRAVERYDDDYVRIVALNSPQKRPESSYKNKEKYNQRNVDVLDLGENRFTTYHFHEIVPKLPPLIKTLFSKRDYSTEQQLKQRNIEKSIFRLNLDKIIAQGHIIEDMRQILRTLSDVYNHAVDVEFTINFTDNNHYTILILQCRPLQIISKMEPFEKPSEIAPKNIILKSNGPIIGHGIVESVNRIIYVSPEEYSLLPVKERYTIARIIGKINQMHPLSDDYCVFLAGPGRWATNSPSLGVPVDFQEIDRVNIVCEILEMHKDLLPDASLGTHFFNDLVESNMLYIALYPTKKDFMLQKAIFGSQNNLFPELLPEFKKYQNIIKVIDPSDGGNKEIKFYADPINQSALLYFE